MRRLAAALALVAWPATAFACPYCAQDRGPAVFLIAAISLVPLLLAGGVALYVRRIGRSERPEA